MALPDVIALARQLIDIPSPSGDEAAMAEALEQMLKGEEFSVERQEVSPNRWNLLARAGGRPRVVLCSHLDTVPPWFASREEGSLIFGRGACDTKGIIAAMLTAGIELQRSGTTELAFLFVVAEETDSLGAKRANIGWADLGCEYIVVGEPTGSRFVRASKGALKAVIRFRGVAAHSAHPELGDSAISKMARAIAEIERADWGSDATLGHGTVNVGVVRGGERPNIIPASAEAEVMFRLVEQPAAVLERLRAIVARHDGEIVSTHGNPAVMMAVPEGADPIVVAFNTDVPHLTNFGRPLLYGPGSILDAHGANEKIGKREIIEAVETYRDLVISLLSGKVKTS